LEEQLIGKTKTLTAKAQRTRRARRKDFFYFAGKVPAKQNPLRRFAGERVFWHGFHGCHGKDEFTTETQRAQRYSFFFWREIPPKENHSALRAERVFWHGFHGCHGKDEDAHHRGVEGFFCHRRTQVE